MQVDCLFATAVLFLYVNVVVAGVVKSFHLIHNVCQPLSQLLCRSCCDCNVCPARCHSCCVAVVVIVTCVQHAVTVVVSQSL